MNKGATWKKNLIRKAKTIQKRVLFMTDDDYKALLEDLFDKTSTVDLTLQELKSWVDALEAKAGNKPQSMPDAQARKIWALWLHLHEISEVRDKSEAALNTFIKNRCRIKVESYRWLDIHQASAVIEQLKQWVKRVERKKAANE